MTASYRHIERVTSRHGKPMVYFRRGKGPRVRLPPDLRSKAFRDAYFAALDGNPTPYVGPARVTYKQRTERAMKQALRAARSRSRKRDCAFDLTLEWALGQVERQGFRCAMTNIPFYETSPVKCRINPYTPSFDRIDVRCGYTPANTRIVIYALNAMLWDWGTDTFEMVANAYRYHRRPNLCRTSIPAPDNPRPAPKKSPRKINALEARK